ncbi:unnamed protein product [Rotaria socialis]
MVQFVLEIAQNFSSIDILIVVDNNTVVTLQIFSSIFRFLQVNESICTEYGLEQASVFGSGKICSAWDKVLYYFSRPIFCLHELYSSSYDLVTADIEYNINGNFTSSYHFPSVFGTFVFSWAHDMVCAIGCSRRLLLAVNAYVQ